MLVKLITSDSNYTPTVCQLNIKCFHSFSKSLLCTYYALGTGITFIHSFKMYLLNAYSVLATEDIAMDKTDTHSYLGEASSRGDR